MSLAKLMYNISCVCKSQKETHFIFYSILFLRRTFTDLSFYVCTLHFGTILSITGEQRTEKEAQLLWPGPGSVCETMYVCLCPSRSRLLNHPKYKTLSQHSITEKCPLCVKGTLGRVLMGNNCDCKYERDGVGTRRKRKRDGKVEAVK